MLTNELDDLLKKLNDRLISRPIPSGIEGSLSDLVTVASGSENRVQPTVTPSLASTERILSNTVLQSSARTDESQPSAASLSGISRILEAGREASSDNSISVISNAASSKESGSDEMGRLVARMDELQRVMSGQSESVQENTRALIESATKAASQSSSGGAASAVGKVFSTIVSSGFGIAPLISDIVGLFRSHPAEPPPLIPFSLPETVKADVGLTAANQFAPISYSQAGTPRTTEASAPAPQITFNIQAMDSRSFMDHSDQIASAVKEAMLHSHSLNDVVSDL